MSDTDEKAAETAKSGNEEDSSLAEATAGLEDVRLNLENPQNTKETR